MTSWSLLTWDTMYGLTKNKSFHVLVKRCYLIIQGKQAQKVGVAGDRSNLVHLGQSAAKIVVQILFLDSCD